MTSKYLERLISLDFEARIVASTPRVLRLLLLRADEVSGLRKAYYEGEVSSADIRAFVDGLLREHATETVFPHQIALAAIAVMLEGRFTDFAEEYLIDLARINNERFWQASRVARICLAQRSVRPRHEVMQFYFRGHHQAIRKRLASHKISVVDFSSKNFHPSDVLVTRAEFDLEHA